MTREYTELLGDYDEHPYFLTVRANPNFDNPVEFAVIVHYDDPETDSNPEIARIDTAHGYTHFDKLYRRDQPKVPLDVDLWGAIAQLENNWRRYAESYDQTDR